MIELLTGKAREKSGAWKKEKARTSKGSISPIIYVEDSPESMQYGLIEEWADSEGYHFDIGFDFSNDPHYQFHYDIGFKGGLYAEGWYFDTRPEAQKAAIIKLNEIMNQ